LTKKFNQHNNNVKRGRSSRATSFAYKGESMSKKPKKSNNQSHSHAQNNHFELRTIKPLTPNQQKTFDAYHQGYNLMIHGYAGTGKTFCALYLALEEILTGNSKYDKIVIIRSVVPSRDMGFLPGSIKDKIAIFEDPYKEICDDLFGRGDGYGILKMKKLIEFTTTSFLRGMTFNNAIVIVDETNNMNMSELDTVMTRLGNNSRIIFCGDYRQTDLNKPHERTGIREFMNITRRINSFVHVEYQKEDVVRSGVVRDYIITKTEMGL
jgi:phosphate starvation-inducible protein PhoH and related proteins